MKIKELKKQIDELDDELELFVTIDAPNIGESILLDEFKISNLCFSPLDFRENTIELYMLLDAQ